jgi:hypothetical protein
VDFAPGHPAAADGASPAEIERRAARAAWSEGDLPAAGEAWLSQEAPPEQPLDRLLLAEALADRGDPRTADLLAALAEPTATELVTARLLWRRGDAAGATAHLAAGLERLRADPWVVLPLVQRSLDLAVVLGRLRPGAGRLADALSAPFAVLIMEQQRRHAWLQLSSRLATFPTHCPEVFAVFEPYVIWEWAFLEARRQCYQANRHPLAGRAERDLRAFLAAAPPVLPDGAPRLGEAL